MSSRSDAGHGPEAHHRWAFALAMGLALAAAWPPCGAAAGAQPLAVGREWLMGTIAEIRVYAITERAAAAAAVEAGLAELRTIDRLMAVQRPESDVSRMNREAHGAAVAVDPRVTEVLLASLEAGRLTGGAFDVTVLPVVAAWGFLEGPPRRPPPGAVRRPAGAWAIAVDARRNQVTFRAPGAGVDLGGIAKGYALDRVRALLRDRGVASAFLDLGGNVATVGVPPDGPRWRIGVRHPRRSEGMLGVLQVGEAAVSTSGDSERFVDDAEGRAGHVIDPRTGVPAAGLVAATVVSASATFGDALSTAALVLGREEGMAAIHRGGGEGILVWEAMPGRLVAAASGGLVFELEAPDVRAGRPR